MSTKVSAARLDRAFNEAISFQAFLDTMKVNRKEIEENFAAQQLSGAEMETVRRPDAPIRILALVHDWCLDVVANLPILARFEEAGLIKLSILEKNPNNTDIGDLYPHWSGEIHIPIYIAFDSDGNELGHFIERTRAMDRKLGAWVRAFWSTKEGHPEFKKPYGELSDGMQNELHTWIAREREKERDEERREFIEWFNSLQK
ncbi:MAG TPA: thioredoxin family protein [Spirochaetia bacterium]|nr:thioredoxin family protein [Spirochaetia bacterium]